MGPPAKTPSDNGGSEIPTMIASQSSPELLSLLFVCLDKQDSTYSLHWFPRRAGDRKTGAVLRAEGADPRSSWVCQGSCSREARALATEGTKCAAAEATQLRRREVGVGRDREHGAQGGVRPGRAVLQFTSCFKGSDEKNHTVSWTTAKWKDTQVHHLEERTLGFSHISL